MQKMDDSRRTKGNGDLEGEVVFYLAFGTENTGKKRRLSFPCLHYEGVYGSGGIAPLILSLDTRWR
jgi:hypothetical protein